MDQSLTIGKQNSIAEKADKFKGIDFKRWQHKMLFYITTLNLAHVLNQEKPMPNKFAVAMETQKEIDAWKHGVFLCDWMTLFMMSM